MIDLARELRVAMETGRVVIGYRETVKAILHGQAKLVFLAANAPPFVKDDVEYYAKLANVRVVTFPGSSWELGAAIRRPHKVSALAIIDPGQSQILSIV